MKDWIDVFRLRTLPLSLSGVIVSCALAVMYDSFNWGTALLLASTTIFLQILSNIANDYGDGVKGTDNAERVGPERGIQSGKISPKQMKSAMIVFVLLSLISGISLLAVSFEGLSATVIALFVLGIGAIAAAIKYTVGNNAFGYSGKGDLFVFIFFGLLAVCGGTYLFTHEFIWETVYPAIAIGCFSVAVLNLNNMRDIENDKAQGKITLAVKMGLLDAKLYHFVIVIIGMSAVAFFNMMSGYFTWGGFLYLISFIPMSIHLAKVNKTKKPL